MSPGQGRVDVRVDLHHAAEVCTPGSEHSRACKGEPFIPVETCGTSVFPYGVVRGPRSLAGSRCKGRPPLEERGRPPKRVRVKLRGRALYTCGNLWKMIRMSESKRLHTFPSSNPQGYNKNYIDVTFASRLPLLKKTKSQE